MHSLHLLCYLEWHMKHCHNGIMQKGVNRRVGTLLANVSVPFVRLCIHVRRYLNSVCLSDRPSLWQQQWIQCVSELNHQREQQNILVTIWTFLYRLCPCTFKYRRRFFLNRGQSTDLLPFHMESSQECLKGRRGHSSKTFPAWVREKRATWTKHMALAASKCLLNSFF